MIEELASIKAATSTRFVSRVRAAFVRAPNTSTADLPARDAGILNSLRTCQVTLDMDQHVIHRECLGATQSIFDSAHAPTWARIPAAPAACHKASKTRIPSQERRSHQTVLADYATSINGQRSRLSKIRKSCDYRPDDGCKSNLMI